MRITAGHWKGREVLSPPGKTTRPLLSRVRQALFDTLQPDIPGASVLDCFGGTGIFGFESLSRGAEHVDAVELAVPSQRVIAQNVRLLGAEAAYRLWPGDVLKVLPRLAEPGRSYDLIFVAPPYYQELAPKVLALLAEHRLLRAGGAIATQYDQHEPSPGEQPAPGLHTYRVKQYGSIRFEFSTREEGSDEDAPHHR